MRHTESELATEPADVRSGPNSFLAGVGSRVRAIRNERGFSRKELSNRCGVSQRFIAQLEGGEGNISICRLKGIVDAMDAKLEQVLPGYGQDEAHRFWRLFNAAPHEAKKRVYGILNQTLKRDEARAQRIALIGLRGAGKSALGADVAGRLKLPFVELDSVMESTNGLEIGEIFALYGPQGYRRLEGHCLDIVIKRYEKVVLAVAGGIVEEPATFRTLLNRFSTIWLSASPDEHMSRVIEQGDRRPMADDPAAMEELKRILREREDHYARATFHIDTSGRSLQETSDELVELLRAGVLSAYD